jgi:PAS domain S-box-containing protein
MHPLLNAALLEQAPDAIIYCDLDGRIELWNAAAAAMFGHSAAQALGESLDIIIPERFRAAHWAGFHRAVASGVAKYHGQVLTTRAAHADGSKLYVDLSFGLIRDAAGAVIGVMSVARINTARAAAAGATAGKT